MEHNTEIPIRPENIMVNWIALGAEEQKQKQRASVILEIEDPGHLGGSIS